MTSYPKPALARRNNTRAPNVRHFLFVALSTSGLAGCHASQVPLLATPPTEVTVTDTSPTSQSEGALAANKADTQSLQCSLSATQYSGVVQFSISNPSSQGWQFLSWHSPFDAWFSRFLHVSQNNEEVPYQGALAKRGAPQAQDWIALAPGQTETVLLDLHQAYQLTDGEYYLNVDPIQLMPLASDKAAKNATPITLSCSALLIQVNQ